MKEDIRVDQERIKAWWFNMVCELIGQNMAQASEIQGLKDEIKRLQFQNTNPVDKVGG